MRVLLHNTKSMLALPGRTFYLKGPGWQPPLLFGHESILIHFEVAAIVLKKLKSSIS